jgi:hypothetical protein
MSDRRAVRKGSPVRRANELSGHFQRDVGGAPHDARLSILCDTSGWLPCAASGSLIEAAGVAT